MIKIVAIGGGEIRDRETFAIDEEIVKLSGKSRPKFLFIPTASSDSVKYSAVILKYYAEKFNCETDVLYLLKIQKSPEFLEEIQSKIVSADIIYVGGGNTLKMMKRWRLLGVDKLLQQAQKKNTVLCGLSAGAICWFNSGHSDSLSAYNKNDWKYINVSGLGFVKGVLCPHYDTETFGISRKTHFAKFMQKLPENTLGIALDENCAIEFIDNTYRIISSKKGAKAYKVYKNSDNKIIDEEIVKSGEFRSIEEIYSF